MAVLLGEGDLGLLGGHQQALQEPGSRLGGAALGRHGLEEPAHHPQVEVDPTEEGIAAGGHHLEAVAGDGEDRDVEGAPAEVVDHQALGGEAPAVAVGQGRRGGLADDAGDLQPREEPRLAHRRALGVAKVRGDRDHHPLWRGAGLLGDHRAHHVEDPGVDLGDGQGAVVEGDRHAPGVVGDQGIGERAAQGLGGGGVELPAQEALGPEDGLLGLLQAPAEGGHPDLEAAPLPRGHHRGQAPTGVPEAHHPRPALVGDRGQGAAGAQIDAQGGRRHRQGGGLGEDADQGLLRALGPGVRVLAPGLLPGELADGLGGVGVGGVGGLGDPRVGEDRPEVRGGVGPGLREGHRGGLGRGLGVLVGGGVGRLGVLGELGPQGLAGAGEALDPHPHPHPPPGPRVGDHRALAEEEPPPPLVEELEADHRPLREVLAGRQVEAAPGDVAGERRHERGRVRVREPEPDRDRGVAARHRLLTPRGSARRPGTGPRRGGPARCRRPGRDRACPRPCRRPSARSP